jgi:thiol-disulfide isomerase/thioredoxin
MPGYLRFNWVYLFWILLAILAIQSVHAAEPVFPSKAPWLNVTRPLTSHDLRGHVVLLDFFTPGCINCIHVLPETEKLEHEFGKRLLIIGVNSPKFTASQQTDNLKGFIERYDIHHPVITDKHMVLWNDYHVYAWPTQVLLGPDGKVVGLYVGEDKYAAIRQDVIQTLASARKAGTLRHNLLPLNPISMPRHGLLQPGKLAVNSRYVAVSDSGHNRVLLLDHRGRVIRVIGNGKRGRRNGTPTQAEFDGPQGLAFRGNILYVADTGNALIRAIQLPEGKVSTVAGNGERGFASMGEYPARQISLNSPWGLKIVGDNLYIAMAGIHQIWRLELDNMQIGPYAGSGNEGITDGSLDEASFAQSSALAYHNNKLYVADPEASAIRQIDLISGEVTTLIGKGLFVFGMKNGADSHALLQHDQGVTWYRHRLYIADTFNNAIRVLNLESQRVSTLATGLSQPGGLAVLNPQTLLVADTNANRIAEVNLASGKVKTWTIKGLGV